MTQSTKLTTIEEAVQDAIAERWQVEHRNEAELERLGFSGDEDVVVLGLDEIEDEVTMEDATRLHYLARSGVLIDRRRAVAIPISSATVAEARQARADEHYGDRGEETDADGDE